MTTDEQAIHDVVMGMEAAWNADDHKGFSARLLDDAAFIHIYGGQLDGRPAIEAAHRQIFDTIYRGSRNSYRVLSIRFLRPDVALAFVHAHLQYTQAGEAREFYTRPTMVMVKEQGEWRVALFQNTRITELPDLSK